MRNRIVFIVTILMMVGLSLPLTAQDEDDIIPAPAGQIVFSSAMAGDGQHIALINTDGTNEILIADLDGNDVTPRWALNGQFLIFNSRGLGDTPYRVDADGENLMPAASVSGFSPNLGPDGKTLTFMTSSNVHIATLNSEEAIPVTSESFSYIPFWSPDGDLIVYGNQSGSGAGTEQQETIRVISPDGSEPEILHTVTGDLEGLVWSRDGEYIAFGLDDGTLGAVYLIEVATGEVIQLTDDSAYFATQPSFSPDGQWVAFQYRTLASANDGSSLCNATTDSIFIIDINGENLQRVTDEGACYPDWRPDIRGQ